VGVGGEKEVGGCDAWVNRYVMIDACTISRHSDRSSLELEHVVVMLGHLSSLVLGMTEPTQGEPMAVDGVAGTQTAVIGT